MSSLEKERLLITTHYQIYRRETTNHHNFICHTRNKVKPLVVCAYCAKREFLHQTVLTGSKPIVCKTCTSVVQAVGVKNSQSLTLPHTTIYMRYGFCIMMSLTACDITDLNCDVIETQALWPAWVARWTVLWEDWISVIFSRQILSWQLGWPLHCCWCNLEVGKKESEVKGQVHQFSQVNITYYMYTVQAPHTDLIKGEGY